MKHRDEQFAFSEPVVSDLYPFLRAEIYTLSSKLQGIQGVMLQPHPSPDSL